MQYNLNGNSPLQSALAWWAALDDMGGFKTAGGMLFPGWTARRACRAPHREDRTPSFSIYCNEGGAWRFKDHATGEQGGLVGFVMLAGKGESEAAKWLMESPPRNDQIPMSNDQLKSSPVTPRSNANHWSLDISHWSFSPYTLSDAELRQCRAMCTSLVQDATTCSRLAAARCWQPETLRNLALDCSLGLHEGRLVMIYPTGAKKRLKPLDRDQARNYEGTKFAWMFGKPDSLWRGELLLPCREHVHITEGETDAIDLIDAGIGNETTELVVAVPGASCWRDEWAPAFSGLHVTLWPDPDKAGLLLAERIIASLSPHVRQIQIAENKPEQNYA